MQATEPIYPCKIRKYAQDIEYSGLSVKDHMMIEFTKAILSNSNDNETPRSYVLKFLGITDDTNFEFSIHYPMYVAKMASLYADAVIKESNK